MKFTLGHYQARRAETRADIATCQHLRSASFVHAAGQSRDADQFDASCAHILISDEPSGRLVGCFRYLPLRSGGDFADLYSAQFYDLSRLNSFKHPIIEIGRFCALSEGLSPDIVRVAWAAITRLVDDFGFAMMVGCSSFPGTDPAPYRQAFEHLYAHHRAPRRWAPGVKSTKIIRFSERRHPSRAPYPIPPLLRSYLAMGAWVSDHAVVDDDLNTLHVFTGLQVSSIPPARQRLLRAFAKC